MHNNEIKKQIFYAYYEIGYIYSVVIYYKYNRRYLEKVIKISEKYNDIFIINKKFIELALFLDEETYKKEKYVFCPKKVVNYGKEIAKSILKRFSQ